MNIEDKERFVAGASTARFRENLSKDAHLQDELKGQVEIDRALGALLNEKSNAEMSQSVMDQLREKKTEARSIPITFSLWRAAALVAFGILPGLLVGRYAFEEKTNGGDPTGTTAITHSPVSSAPSVDQAPDQAEGLIGQTLAAVGQLDGMSFAEALAHLEKTLKGSDKVRAIELLLSRRAQTEPDEVLATVLGKERPYSSLALERTSKLFAAWSRIDADAALAAAEKLPGNAKKTALQEVLNWLARSNPARFVELASDGKQTLPSNWKSAFKQLQTEDEAQAFELLETLSDENRKAALAGIAESMAAANPSEALAWAEEFTDAAGQSAALASVIETIGLSDPYLAGNAIQRHPGRFPEVEKKIMQRIRVERPHAALDWVLAHSSDETKPMLFRDLLMATAKDADNRVFDVFESLIEKEGFTAFRKDFRIDDIFWGTSGLDYERGINWVNSLPKDVYGWRYMAPSMVFAWSHHDRAAAQEFTQTIEDPVVRQRMNSAIVHNMLSTTQDFEQTWEFVSSLPADQHANDYAKLLDRWARLYPAEAAKRVASIPEDGTESAIQSVAANWGALAPNEAVEWLGSLGSQKQRELAVQSIAASWAKSDLYAASKWVGNLETGVERDLAAAELVNEVAPFEGDSAFLWALEISGEEKRNQALSTAVTEWAKQDADEARLVVESSELSATMKNSLLRTIADSLLGNPSPKSKKR